MKAEIDLDFCNTPLQSGLEQLAQLLADKVLVSGETMDKQSYPKHQRLTPYNTRLAWSYSTWILTATTSCCDCLWM